MGLKRHVPSLGTRHSALGTRRAARAVLVLAGIASLSGGGAAQAPAPAAAEVVDISAERFTFTPSEVKTTAGTTLEFRLASDDTDHGFRIPGTDINVSIPKRGRGTVSVRFTPDKPGRYTFECSHVCGAGHSFMRGVIVVRER